MSKKAGAFWSLSKRCKGFVQRRGPITAVKGTRLSSLQTGLRIIKNATEKYIEAKDIPGYNFTHIWSFHGVSFDTDMVLIGGNILIPSKRMTEENPGVSEPSEAEVNSNASRETIEEDHDEEECSQNEELEERVPSPAPLPVIIKEIPIGDPRIRSKIKFQVVTAHVTEVGGKKHVLYTIMMKRLSDTSRPAIINRRYNDFNSVYECILRSYHPSVLGDFQFPKKVLIGNFKAEVITERTEAFHKFLNLISASENLLYSDYFYSFLSSDEHNEAVSHIKLGRFSDAVPLLENIFNVREKLLTISSFYVLSVLCELIACQEASNRKEAAFAHCLVAVKSFELLSGLQEAEILRVPFLLLASALAESLGQSKKPFDRKISELRYKGVKVSGVKSLLEVVQEKYIHVASHTSK